jgi:hypothetical protein
MTARSSSVVGLSSAAGERWLLVVEQSWRAAEPSLSVVELS